MELSLYAISRAIESFFLCVRDVPVVRLLRSYLPRRLDVLLFSVASAFLMHAYSDKQGRHRDKFKSKYLNAFDFLLGNAGHDRAAIRHIPSNRDLRRRLMTSFRSRDGDPGGRLRKQGSLRAVGGSLPDVRQLARVDETPSRGVSPEMMLSMPHPLQSVSEGEDEAGTGAAEGSRHGPRDGDKARDPRD